MAKTQPAWAAFYDECDEACNRANKRAANLASFGALLVVLAVLTLAAYVVAAIQTKRDDRSFDAAVYLPAAVGSAVTLLLFAAVLFGLSSLVDAAGKQLAITLRTERLAGRDPSWGPGAMNPSTPLPPPPLEQG